MYHSDGYISDRKKVYHSGGGISSCVYMQTSIKDNTLSTEQPVGCQSFVQYGKRARYLLVMRL